MITFDESKKNYKSYYFYDIPNIYMDYKNNIIDVWGKLCSEYIDYEKITPKDFNDECKIIGIEKFCEKIINSDLYKERKYKDKSYSIVKMWDDQIFIQEIHRQLTTDNEFFKNEFLKIIFVSDKDTLAQQELDIFEEISEQDFCNFIKFVLALENFDVPNYKLNYDDLLIFYRCLENFHTHSSKYVHSSSDISLNVSNSVSSDRYLNSRTTKYGIPMTIYEGGGFGRSYTNILKSLNTVFRVNDQTVSLFSVLVSLKEMKSLTKVENYIIQELNFAENDIKHIYSLSLKIPLGNDDYNEEEKSILNSIKNQSLINIKKKKERNYNHLSQIIWFNDGDFENLIPIPSVKVFSALSVLKTKVKEKITQRLIEEEGILDEKKVLEIQKKVVSPSVSIKSVLSNPQNVSAFLSFKNAWLVRFNSYKYIKQKSTIIERQFHYLESIMLKNKICDKDLSTQYTKFLIEGKIKLNLLPNSVVKNMFYSFSENLAREIVFNLKAYKRNVLKMESKKIERLAQNILDKSSDSYYQKYVLNIATPDEINQLSNKLVYMYENIASLDNEKVKVLSNKIERLLCL